MRIFIVISIIQIIFLYFTLPLGDKELAIIGGPFIAACFIIINRIINGKKRHATIEATIYRGSNGYFWKFI